ncbi:hypothetical protein EHI8A_054880 [Entamoeba histolytica HM-1:IMSS-B]|uniref:Uncharacterized protein n=6 Tax=Entamoeba histolytica TaxID=5759 RepID=B1N4D2_ENTH1|nr:hypothetical protein EHI_192820 [Entamoeba histolytica HM-1:IMSS]EMD44608.1 Hypothetical protein EHI5A_051880 [Entamoeba histolytica KU27]EMH72891.1 hypothetical protein EHI8A_054880 [Entamoeba histolytica HM-1:IMSS-B]EMS16915.1 hypothetical protein KM1_106110 [Entamoeba histolytica HM-3:IMSS]ENY63319.1 hypothetical protein EHI7A_055900 [Entamoeba histolytica HM-1:IMSS-A]GAT98132.1 hypothetical protein CL6EHI_192820 [Entamoeba histolytica]|eukprot:XP_001914048.1 hypothetical protein EHI_192820 [Entamoeba histolytica HM-1:IMSS]
MRNLTKLIIIGTVLVVINLFLQFPDTAMTVNLINCDDIRPVKLVVKSKGYYPRHLSQCGWKINDLMIHIVLLVIPFFHNLLDPFYHFTRVLRRIIIFTTSLLLLLFSTYTLIDLIHYPTSIVQELFHFSRSSFIFNVLIELFLSICWLISVFTSMNLS